MPGPCSAPNGNYFITVQKRDKNSIVKSGKTAKKRGANFDKDRATVGKNASHVHGNRKLSAARRREQESTE